MAENNDEVFFGPAVVCNEFYITLNSHDVRIAFAENYSTEEKSISQFRTAVVLSYKDTVELLKVLRTLLEERFGLTTPIE